MEQQNLQLLSDGLNALSAAASDDKVQLLAEYCRLVTEANARFNLTAILDERDFVIKHILDSAAACTLIPHGARLLDIGSGAGFPAVPLAILRDDIYVTALDSTAKKMTFVAESAAALGIKNVRAVAGRAEEKREFFATFDIVTARAVSSLNILLELAAPMLKTGGKFIAYKSDDSELPAAQNALHALKMRHSDTKSLSIEGNFRALLSFEKLAPTPAQYPRRYGAIKKSPL